jgi:hypothetical protein
LRLPRAQSRRAAISYEHIFDVDEAAAPLRARVESCPMRAPRFGFGAVAVCGYSRITK